MTGPATPGQEGPSYGPPSLPQGWIAQWDGTSKKYYFVQLSTGLSQWETPTQPAPTVGTPTATPGHDMSPFPQPGEQQAVGERGLSNESDGERGLGQMAMNTLLHSQGGGQGGKQSNPLLGLAGQLISGSMHHQTQQSSNTGAGGLVGALAGSLLGGGTKPNAGPQQSYSGQQPQYGQQSGLMGKLGDFIGGQSGGSHHSNSFGYSEGGQTQGGYTGQAPPSSYQPAGQPSNPYYNPQQPSQSQYPPDRPNPGTTSSYSSQHQQQTTYGISSPPASYGMPSQQPPYGAPSQQPPYGAPSQQPAYGAPSQQSEYGVASQQPAYGSSSQQTTYGTPSQQATYGASLQQPAYGASSQQPAYGALPQQSYGVPPQGGQPPYPNPTYNGQSPSGNLPQQQHHMFQGIQSASHHGGLYGDGAPPQGQGGYEQPGGYNELPGPGRW